MKAIPLAYNKDMQEDKEPIFDAYNTILGSLHIFTGMLSDLTVHEQRMAAATTHDFSNATELADYLATKGVPFRQAHAIVGELVLKGIKTGTALQEMPLSELQEAAPQIQADVYAELTSKAAVNRRTSLGGTAVSNVLKEVTRDEKIIADHENAGQRFKAVTGHKEGYGKIIQRIGEEPSSALLKAILTLIRVYILRIRILK